MNNSPTARDLINTMRNLGTRVEIIDSGATGNAGSYSPTENVIKWDPFTMAQGHNQDGTIYTISPIMVLAHEIAHAAERGNPLMHSESYVMMTSNQIAREVNSATGRNYDTGRDTHSGSAYFTTSSYSDNPAMGWTNNRPQCSQ